MADLPTQDKAGISVFLSGLVVFLYQTGEILVKHTDWSFLSTPPGVGEFCIAFAAAVAAMIGAGMTDFQSIFNKLRGKP